MIKAVSLLSVIFFLTTLNWPTLVGCSAVAAVVAYCWDYLR